MATASPPTSPSTPRLSEVARHVRPAGGIVSTGWPSVAAKCRDLGIVFRWWQVLLGQLILAKRADGKYAATIGGTGMSIPRQVGKTFLVGAIVFALCLLRKDLTVIWTAHRMKTSAETFQKMQALARRKRIAPFVDRIVRGSGDEAIYFTNGSRILFGARERGFGRGFDRVDVLIFDEAQILTEAAMDDMIPATNQSKQDTGALLLFMGTPPRPKDPGEVFTRMREEALAGEDLDTTWVEMGADPGYKFTALPAPLSEADWEQIAKANPSYPDDTPREAILRMRKKLGSAAFLREGAGVWDRIAKQFSPINGALWADNVGPGPDIGVKPDGFGVDMSHGRKIAIGACWVDQVDGDDEQHQSAHLEVVWAGVDEAAAVAWIKARAGRRIPVFIDSMSPAASMIAPLKALGVKVRAGSSSEMARACGLVQSENEAGRMTHADQERLNDAREAARKRLIGKAGGWAFDVSDPGTEIYPLVAVALARLAASTKKKPTGGGRGGRASTGRTSGNRTSNGRRAGVVA